MIRNEDILSMYFDYLLGLVCVRRYGDRYSTLLEYLHSIEFRWIIKNDANRAADGINLRNQFSEDEDINPRIQRRVLNTPCSVLEMMVGLAYRCENSIMGDEEYGDRTGKWFWLMIQNLGLEGMNNHNFDEEYVFFKVSQFLDREYARDGEGSLFYIPRCHKDLRKVELWYQMCWYLDTII